MSQPPTGPTPPQPEEPTPAQGGASGAVPPPPGAAVPPPPAAPPVQPQYPPAGAYPPPAGAYPPPAGAYPPPVGGYQVPAAAPSPTEPFGLGWKAFTSEGGVFVGAAIIWVIIGAVVVGITSAIAAAGGGSDAAAITARFSGVGGALLSGVFALVAALIQAVFVRVALEVTRGRRAGFADFFTFTDAGPVVITALILAVVNLVLGFIPFFGNLLSLVVSFLTMFVYYVLLDRKVAPVDAIRASIQLVSGNLGTVVLFFLITVAIWIGAAITCGLGLIVAVPWVLLSTTYLYRRLNGEQVVVPA